MRLFPLFPFGPCVSLDGAGSISFITFSLAAHAIELPLYDGQSFPMNVRLHTPGTTAGQYIYTKDSRELLALLKRTDLSGDVLESFTDELRSGPLAQIEKVELKDSALRHIGYFLD